MTEDRIYDFEDFMHSEFAHDIILDLGDNNHTYIDNSCIIKQLTKRLEHSYGLLVRFMDRLGNTGIVDGEERTGYYLTEMGCELYKGLSTIRNVLEKTDGAQQWIFLPTSRTKIYLIR